MSNGSSSVSFMKEYLRYALEFEKYVYIWNSSMNEANSRMRLIHNRRSELESERDSARASLASLNARLSSQRDYNQKEAAKCSKKAKIALVVLIIDILLCLTLGIVGSHKISVDAGVTAAWRKLALFVIIAVAAYFLTFIGPVCAGIYSSNIVKRKNFSDQAGGDCIDSSRRRQELLLRDKEAKANNDYAVSLVEETVLSKHQDEILAQLKAAKNNLAGIYAKNVLPAKYRCINAVATLYEYLETGRCNTIEGHGGIYDTYETDLQRGLIIETLSDIRDSMYRIESNQKLLYRELQQANSALSGIRTSLNSIEKTNAEIAKNTAISAVADKQTAEAARWMAWNTWARGY